MCGPSMSATIICTKPSHPSSFKSPTTSLIGRHPLCVFCELSSSPNCAPKKRLGRVLLSPCNDVELRLKFPIELRTQSPQETTASPSLSVHDRRCPRAHFKRTWQAPDNSNLSHDQPQWQALACPSPAPCAPSAPSPREDLSPPPFRTHHDQSGLLPQQQQQQPDLSFPPPHCCPPAMRAKGHSTPHPQPTAAAAAAARSPPSATTRSPSRPPRRRPTLGSWTCSRRRPCPRPPWRCATPTGSRSTPGCGSVGGTARCWSAGRRLFGGLGRRGTEMGGGVKWGGGGW